MPAQEELEIGDLEGPTDIEPEQGGSEELPEGGEDEDTLAVLEEEPRFEDETGILTPTNPNGKEVK